MLDIMNIYCVTR